MQWPWLRQCTLLAVPPEMTSMPKSAPLAVADHEGGLLLPIAIPKMELKPRTMLEMLAALRMPC